MIPEVPPGLAVLTIQLPAQCLITREIFASWDKAFEPLLALPAIWCQVVARDSGQTSPPHPSGSVTWLYSVYVHRGPALAGNVLEAGSAKGSKTVPVSPCPVADMCTWEAGRESGMGAILRCRIFMTCCQEPSSPACSGTAGLSGSCSLISGYFCPQRVCCRLLSRFIWLLGAREQLAKQLVSWTIFRWRS